MSFPVIYSLENKEIYGEKHSGYTFTQQVGEVIFSAFFYQTQYWRVHIDSIEIYNDFELIRFVGPQGPNSTGIIHVPANLWWWVHDCALYILLLDDPFQRNESIVKEVQCPLNQELENNT